jgi:arylsulfatase
VRSQFCHATDLLPTVLEANEIDAPAVIDGVDQQPFNGTSILPALDDPTAPSAHTVQYFEMFGSRAIYGHGWKAVTDHVGQQVLAERELVPGSHDFDTDRWSLFHLENDFAEVHDLAASEPDRLRNLIDLWWTEAGRNNVLPLDDTMMGRVAAMQPSPNPRPTRYIFHPFTRIAEDAAPPVGGNFTIHADLEVPESRPEGVLCAQGDWTSGWGLYVLAGRPVFAFNYLGIEVHRAVAQTELPPGPTQLVLEVRRHAPDRATCSFIIDGNPAGSTEITRGFPFRWQIGGSMLRIGYDAGFPICDDYQVPFPFNGTLHRLMFETPASGTTNPLTEVEVALHSD